MQKNILITKASGEQATYDPEKLRRSLRRAGAGEEVVDAIEKEIGQLLYPGMTTKKIYRRAFSLLKKASAHVAAKYKLKKALQQLGPAGYPFEKYVGEIFRHEGYEVQVGQIVQGHCVQHEVDVIAQKENRHFMIECKFHSDDRRKCDVKIPLYIYARFLDVEKAWIEKPGHAQKFHQGWVVTNTKFSGDAIQYGTCVGLQLTSWDYPKKGSLRERIDRSGLHPLTCLTTLTKKEKQQLLDKGIVLCKELCQQEHLLNEIGVHPTRAKKVLEEAGLLCQSKIEF